jgi:hypothetical protein
VDTVQLAALLAGCYLAGVMAGDIETLVATEMRRSKQICIHYVRPVSWRGQTKTSRREREGKREILVYSSFKFLIKSCHACSRGGLCCRCEG